MKEEFFWASGSRGLESRMVGTVKQQAVGIVAGAGSGVLTP